MTRKQFKHASTIYLNGTIVTMDSANTITSALAVDGEQIIAVGTEQDIKPLMGPDTKVIDLAGKTLLPGFYDSHSHFGSAGQSALYQVNLNSPPIGTMTSIKDYIITLKHKAKDTPAGKWIIGNGYDDTLVAEKRHPTRYDLDLVSTEHPVYIAHISGHLAAVNSKALELAGITRDTPAPEGGAIHRDPSTGEPNGVLAESATDLVSKLLPPLTVEEKIAGIAHASMLYAQKGVTTANTGGIDVLGITMAYSDYKRAIDEGKLKIRLAYWLSLKEIENKQIPDSSSMITVGGVKEFQDGSIQGYTGYLSKPYHTPYGGAPHFRGYPRQSRAEITDIVKKVHNAGLQLYIHGNGDAAIDDILYAYEQAQKEHPRPDARHVVIHAQMAREDQLDKMKQLSVIPSFFSLHTYYWGDRHRDIFMGPERAFRMSPAKSALKRNIPFTIHCDTPVVPQNPLLAVWATVNRISSSGQVIGKEQRVSPLAALRAYTINAAYQNFEEKTKGSIETGKLADFVILSENPLACQPEHIKDIEVLETVVGGNTVYKATAKCRALI